MTPHVVVDVGNTRVKWGLVGPGRSIARTASLPEDPEVWERELGIWRATTPLGSVSDPLTWVLASVRPARSERLRGWLEARGDQVVLLERAVQLPLAIGLEDPDRSGIDRLLNAVAASLHLPLGRGAVLIDAGSAVTVDWLDEEHVYRGGCIFPGLDLMAEALHGYTALLPRVRVTWPVAELPAAATVPAMQVGVFLAVSGGIREAVRLYTARARVVPRVFFSGGQAPLLVRAMKLPSSPLEPTGGGKERKKPGSRRDPIQDPWDDFLLWPEQTLVGILRSVEALP